ncbi:MAG: MbnP family protein [Ferruginibacter sp.]
MKALQLIYICITSITLNAACQKSMSPAGSTGSLKITFTNVVKGNPVGLGSTMHTNPFGETYTITKLKYYISNIRALFPGMTNAAEKESYHLVDQNNSASLSFSFPLQVNSYNVLEFLLGVDSLRNVSGAQTGALDPLNDMFWTWNSGYIMAKMEAISPQSNQVNNKVEYHIGGFSGANSSLKYITLPMPGLSVINIREGKTTEVVIEADIDKWWQQPADIKITDIPVCNTPGALAKKIADNYSDMFTIKSVTNY